MGLPQDTRKGPAPIYVRMGGNLLLWLLTAVVCYSATL
jgi:hypothetical protein